MDVIIRREVALAPCHGLYYQTLGTDNNSHGEPAMAMIIRREVALACCGGLYYQT